MFDSFIQGLFLVLEWQTFLIMLLGIFLGFWVGLLPGLGGSTTLALMLPFIYKMSAVEAFAFLLGMHSVVATTGDITSVLFGCRAKGPPRRQSSMAMRWQRGARRAAPWAQR